MRARNIKPGFFVNENLAERSPLARLLFIGLWCLADREGRLENRPKRIKAQLLPFDEVDVEDLLGELEKHSFIECYTADNCAVIQILSFAKHQKPHPKEKPSELPSREKVRSSREKVFMGDGSSPLDLGSGILDFERGILKEGSKASPPSPRKSDPPFKEIQSAWNQHVAALDAMPEWRDWTSKRKTAARKRWESPTWRQSWREAIKRIPDCPFLTGQNDRAWKISPDFLLKPDTATKILEGCYSNQRTVKAGDFAGDSNVGF